MNNLELALAQASNGWPVFPCRQDKRPKSGLNDWENVASTDPDQINQWWAENPDFLVAVPPGRLGKAVIDVDRHEGKADGFLSLEEREITLPDTFNKPSLSGNGQHYWFDGEIGSVNGVLPGIDRKARGGYIITNYVLPAPDQITTPLPKILSHSPTSLNVHRKNMTGHQLNVWLQDVGAGEPDEAMWEVIERFRPEGNQQMSVNIARVVSLAARGHPGAHEALGKMLEIWVGGVHSSGDPEEEFFANVRSAVEKFGEPIPETTVEDKWNDLIKPKAPEPVNHDDLKDSLLTYCISLRENFLQILQTNQRVREVFIKCIQETRFVKTEEHVKVWRTHAKRRMKGVLDNA